MKAFKDITFKQHKLGKGNIQGLLTLDNGVELSVVAGKGMYSSSKDGVRASVDDVKDVLSFEVAVFDDGGNFIESDSGSVLGWQSRSDINNLIQIHA